MAQPGRASELRDRRVGIKSSGSEHRVLVRFVASALEDLAGVDGHTGDRPPLRVEHAAADRHVVADQSERGIIPLEQRPGRDPGRPKTGRDGRDLRPVPGRVVAVGKVARGLVELELKPAVGVGSPRPGSTDTRERCWLVGAGHEVEGEMMDIDLGAGDRFAVGVEHAAMDRERADRVERVGAVSGCGAARPSSPSRGRGVAPAFRWLISRRDQGGRGRPGHQPGTQKCAAETSLSFWISIILSTSRVSSFDRRRDHPGGHCAIDGGQRRLNRRLAPAAGTAAWASRRKTVPSIAPSCARPRRPSRALSRSPASLSRRAKVRSLNRNSPAAWSWGMPCRSQRTIASRNFSGSRAISS